MTNSQKANLLQRFIAIVNFRALYCGCEEHLAFYLFIVLLYLSLFIM